ncbi:MAG TPA: permease, partial [Acidobacteria bacterium]|nr:permease [Acidobacteriota bacterium]
VDAVLAPLERLMEGPAGTDAGLSSAERDAVLAALNGVLGDHLVWSGNPLAIGMRLRTEGAPTGKILLLAHGLCLNDRQWRRNGHDHGAALAADGGLTPVYLRYNSGLPLAINGRELAGHLEDLLRDWPVPVEELVVLAHSMGGLVVRHACHIAEAEGHRWRRHLRKIVFLGTPHHGSPLEKGGHWVDLLLGASPYTAALARIGKIRSAGITDLRHGSDLALPAGVAVYAIAASRAQKDEIGLKDTLLGDGLVPLRSALGEHEDPGRSLEIPASRKWAGYGLGHFDLLDNREVYERIREWVIGL